MFVCVLSRYIKVTCSVTRRDDIMWHGLLGLLIMRWHWKTLKRSVLSLCTRWYLIIHLDKQGFRSALCGFTSLPTTIRGYPWPTSDRGGMIQILDSWSLKSTISLELPISRQHAAILSFSAVWASYDRFGSTPPPIDATHFSRRYGKKQTFGFRFKSSHLHDRGKNFLPLPPRSVYEPPTTSDCPTDDRLGPMYLTSSCRIKVFGEWANPVFLLPFYSLGATYEQPHNHFCGQSI